MLFKNYIKDPPSTYTLEQKKEYILNHLVANGFTELQAKAVLGNLLQENPTLNPNTTNNIGATGIGQWLGARKTGLEKQYGKEGMYSFTNQVDWLTSELKSVGGDAWGKKATERSIFYNPESSLELATAAITKGFFRPGEHEEMIDNRIAYATGLSNTPVTGNQYTINSYRTFLNDNFKRKEKRYTFDEVNPNFISYLSTIPEKYRNALVLTDSEFYGGRKDTSAHFSKKSGRSSYINGLDFGSGDKELLKEAYDYMKNDPKLKEYGLAIPYSLNHGTAPHIHMEVIAGKENMFSEDSGLALNLSETPQPVGLPQGSRTLDAASAAIEDQAEKENSAEKWAAALEEEEQKKALALEKEQAETQRAQEIEGLQDTINKQSYMLEQVGQQNRQDNEMMAMMIQDMKSKARQPQPQQQEQPELPLFDNSYLMSIVTGVEPQQEQA